MYSRVTGLPREPATTMTSRAHSSVSGASNITAWEASSMTWLLARHPVSGAVYVWIVAAPAGVTVTVPCMTSTPLTGLGPLPDDQRDEQRTVGGDHDCRGGGRGSRPVHGDKTPTPMTGTPRPA